MDPGLLAYKWTGRVIVALAVAFFAPVILLGFLHWGWMLWDAKRKRGPAKVLPFRVPTREELATLEDFHRTIDDIEKGTQKILREKGLIK